MIKKFYCWSVEFDYQSTSHYVVALMRVDLPCRLCGKLHLREPFAERCLLLHLRAGLKRAREDLRFANARVKARRSERQKK